MDAFKFGVTRLPKVWMMSDENSSIGSKMRINLGVVEVHLFSLVTFLS